LTGEEVEFCFQATKIVDTAGYAPTDILWTAAYKPALGVAKAWKLKAGKAAGDYDFSDLGQKYNRSQVIKHCLEMYNFYSGSILVDMITPSDLTISDDDEEILVYTVDDPAT
jgi:hypothetical protein